MTTVKYGKKPSFFSRVTKRPNYYCNCTGISQKLCVAAAELVEAKAVRATRLRLRQAQATATCIVTVKKTLRSA